MGVPPWNPDVYHHIASNNRQPNALDSHLTQKELTETAHGAMLEKRIQPGHLQAL